MSVLNSSRRVKIRLLKNEMEMSKACCVWELKSFELNSTSNQLISNGSIALYVVHKLENFIQTKILQLEFYKAGYHVHLYCGELVLRFHKRKTLQFHLWLESSSNFVCRMGAIYSYWLLFLSVTFFVAVVLRMIM